MLPDRTLESIGVEAPRQTLHINTTSVGPERPTGPHPQFQDSRASIPTLKQCSRMTNPETWSSDVRCGALGVGSNSMQGSGLKPGFITPRHSRGAALGNLSGPSF